MKRILIFGTILGMLLFSAAAFAADIAVIVNKGNTNDVNKDLIENIYKGEKTSWPAGGAVTIYDLPESSDTRADFTQALLGKTVSAMKAVWSVKLFSGKATPPKVLNSDEDVRSAVANNKNAIGYIKASSANDSVKTVLTLK